MSPSRTDILMYHSISEESGPTSISKAIFAGQVQAIADAGIAVITMDEVAQQPAATGRAKYSIAITFDDGFEDFEHTAWPILQSHGFVPTVYLPSELIGCHENWAKCNLPPRKIMDWPTIERLANEGVQFGSHSRTHPDLTGLPAAELEDELLLSQRMIQTRLGRPSRHFAPPYGYSNVVVKNRIARHYSTSVGTRLGTAASKSDLHDLPRLEMFYFSNPRRWHDHISGRGKSYLIRQKFMRKVGQLRWSSAAKT